MTVFVTGGTGYMGVRLIPQLIARGHTVRAMARQGSEHKLPEGCTLVIGDALDGASYSAHVAPAEAFVHLVGVSHPSPAKARQFREVDLASARAAVSSAVSAGIRHFIYVSVAHPAPVMRDYIAARSEAETLIRDARLNTTILRPWYVLGPGHRWPAALRPLYWLAERFPRTRDAARRLGLVTIDQMVAALAGAVEHPAEGVRVVEAPEIRSESLRPRHGLRARK